MVIGLICAGLLLFGGGAMLFQIAGDRGRDGSVWALVGIAVSGLAAYGAWQLVAPLEDPGLWVALAPIGAAIGGHVVTAVALVKLPPAGLDPRASRWAMDRLGDGGLSESVSVVFGADRLEVRGDEGTSTQIKLADIREARADGEVLTIRWGEDSTSELRLCPQLESNAREAAVRFCIALARRIEDGRVTRPPRAVLRSDSRR